MPADGSSAEIINSQNSTKKKRTNKKRRQQQQQQQRKYQSKTRLLDGNDANGSVSNGMKNSLNSNRCETNKLTPANLASLRWDNILTDPILENERIERYKELRRQRYTDARQHTVQNLLEQMQMNTTKESPNITGNEQQ